MGDLAIALVFRLLNHHHGASFLRPANFCHNGALRLTLSPFVRVSRCFLAGFIVEGILTVWEGGEVQA